MDNPLAVSIHGPFMVCVLFACLRLPASAEPGSTDSADDSPPPTIEALIRNLGDESFRVRERATEELSRMSDDAIPPLEKAAEAGDPEVRVRARAIIERIRLGVTPDWPAPMVKLAESYASLATEARVEALGVLAKELKEKAAPFLTTRLASRDATEAGAALQALRPLMEEHPRVAERVAARYRKPDTQAQRKAAAWASSCAGDAPEALRALKGIAPKDPIFSEVYEKAVKDLVAKLGDAQFEKVREQAGKLVEAAPTDARFLYIEAEALASVGRGDEATKLRDRALALHPDDEEAHYHAGDTLEDLGRHRLAKREWEAILKMPPVDDLYDANARFRLSAILNSLGDYQGAVDHLEKGISLWKGNDLAMVGGDEKMVQERLRSLRLKAAKKGNNPPGDGKEDTGLQLRVQIEVRDGKIDELRDAIERADRVLTLTVRPLGLRVLDQPNASLRYDAANQQLRLLINDQSSDEPVPLVVKGDKARIVVHSLDGSHVFEISTASGEVKRLARYQKNYLLKFTPTGSLTEFTAVEALINDQTYDWEDMKEGVRFDFLPEALQIRVTGTNAAGERQTIRREMKVKDPAKLPAKREEEGE